MLINIPLRFKNKAFWIAFIPSVVVFIQAFMAIFGVSIDLSELSGRIIAAVDALFVVLMLLGVVSDFTTDGFSDSQRVLDYTEPAPNAIETMEEE